MGIKHYDDNPTIADDIILDIDTYDVDNCIGADPYKVDEVILYFVQRDFTGNRQETAVEYVDALLASRLEQAKANACAVPSSENLEAVGQLQAEYDLTVTKESFFYREATVVAKWGTSENPAWLSTDTENAVIEHVTADEEGNALTGRFAINWKPVGMREGDYFFTWRWSPNPSGDKLSRQVHFHLAGNTQITTSIPTHYTREGKYETLQERYTPDMFKMTLGPSDISPQVIQELNNAVAKGFTTLENLANQMVDLVDSNATHESLLQLLGNTFGLKLRTDDPTLWRRQIKRAVPLFKKKGTLNGLTEALAQAGIRLQKYTRLWQVVSSHTYQDAFIVTDSTTFKLSKQTLPYDADNFTLYYRAADSDNWTTKSHAFVYLDEVNNTITWDDNNDESLHLAAGDGIRVIYPIKEIQSGEQSNEDYIRTLPLADQRDERDQVYPLKNWNVRVIDEDDPLLNTIVPVRHPYHDMLVYGKVRTEFPYSENIYNMEEYNGSKRDSYNPCDIDIDFLDPCTQGLSSKYSVDLEIERLSNDRLAEAREILNEFTPLHALLHSINLMGGFSEYIRSPEEFIESLVHINGEEMANLQQQSTAFNRHMMEPAQLKRNMLASVSTVGSGTGTARNTEIILFSPNVNLEEAAIASNPVRNRLEVLSPSSNIGLYGLGNAKANYAVVADGTPVEPLNTSSFAFRLSNDILRKTSTTIEQANHHTLSDPNINFIKLGVRSQVDADDDPSYSGNAWSIVINGVNHTVLDILSDGSLFIADSVELPETTSSNITYSVHNGAEVAASTTGKIRVSQIGRVILTGGTVLVRGVSTPSSSINDIRHLVPVGSYALIDGTQYKVIGFQEGETHQLYVEGYDGGDASGVDVTLYQRVIDNEVGYFHYQGIQLLTGVNYESTLGIQNGDNELAGDEYKENFLVLIGTDYFAISSINGSTLTLAGPHRSWKTTGTSINYSILHYQKEPFVVQETITAHPPDTIQELFSFSGSYEFPLKRMATTDGFDLHLKTFSTDWVLLDNPEDHASIDCSQYGVCRLIWKKQEELTKGTAVAITYTSPNENQVVPGFEYDFIDRRGTNIIEMDGPLSMQMVASTLNAANKDQVVDSIDQDESISFQIEHREE